MFACSFLARTVQKLSVEEAQGQTWQLGGLGANLEDLVEKGRACEKEAKEEGERIALEAP